VLLLWEMGGEYAGMKGAEKYALNPGIAVAAGALVCGLAAVLLKRIAVFFVAGACGALLSIWAVNAFYPSGSQTVVLVTPGLTFTVSGALSAVFLKPIIIVATSLGGGGAVALGAMTIAKKNAAPTIAGKWDTVLVLGVCVFIVVSVFGIAFQHVWGKGKKLPVEVESEPPTGPKRGPR